MAERETNQLAFDLRWSREEGKGIPDDHNIQRDEDAEI
jgi:hypothetical protein